MLLSPVKVVITANSHPHPLLGRNIIQNSMGLSVSEIRDRCAEGSWDVFNKYLEQTQPLNGKVYIP